ncbi:MAG TPA: RNA polymerase factor sigma-32 [Polyangiaceae bacterium]|nr:RNA polymerase factor sigma-32 [Polyangiaceae bacterium]
MAKKKPSKPRAPKAQKGREPEESDDATEAEAEETDGDEDHGDDELGDDVVEAEAEVVDRAELEKIGEKEKSTGLTRADPLSLYMREVQRHPLLTPDEEHKLAVAYSKDGDVDAAARLVTANLRLVVKLAYEYRRAYRNIMDLIQEGNIGLMQAVKRYDPHRGVKLSSYAAWWIRAYMLRFILNNWRLVKIGTTQAQRRLFFNLNKEKARLSAMGIEPSHAAIASSLKVDEKDVIEMDRRLARSDASLDAPVGDSEGRKTTRMDLLPSYSEGPEAATESAELSELVREQLDEFRTTLAGKELDIFDKRLVAEDPLTLQELGDQFGVSRERVRQLEARLTGKLREFLKSKLGDAVEVGG